MMLLPSYRLLRVLVMVCFFVAFQGASAEAQGDQREIRSATNRMAKSIGKKDWPKAIELGHRLVELAPSNHVHPYNLACVYALSGNSEQAVLWLANATRAGFRNADLMEDDPDLDSVRETKGYALALKAAKVNAQHARELFLEAAQKSEPVIWLPEEIADGEKLPVLIVLHGFGGNADRFGDFFKEFAQKERLILIAPRTVIPTGGGGFEWGRPDEAAVLVDRALDLVKAKHPVDPHRVVLLGFSQGGRTAFHLALEHPFRFQGAIPIAGRFNPAALNGLSGSEAEFPRFFLMVGAQDGSLASNRQALKDLSLSGVKTKLAVYPAVGHSFPSYWQGEVRKALKFIFQDEKN